MAEQDIRNILQTHSERPIIKMAPDLVVYIDGLPYLFNDYIGEGGVIVNFNDFVVSANGAVDTETFIPACNITLSVPVDLRSLFAAPGGNRILKVMSEVKIFAKGYYLTAEGDSVYHRVFWGVLTSVTHADNKKTLEITLSCKGILHLFDLMQINTNPAVMTSEATGSSVTAFATKDSDLSPFGIIFKTFMVPLKDDVIDQSTVAKNNTAEDRATFRRAYIDKWSNHLLNLQKSVRLFGLKARDLKNLENPSKPAEGVNNPGTATVNQSGKSEQKASESDRQKLFDVNLISRFLPDFRIGSIGLLQSSTTSRLSRVREMANAMGWEAYQDLDGSVIFKPPLYNLDTRLSDCDINRNPFVINLPEIIGADTELEDESQVRLTRLEVFGTISNTPLVEGGEDIMPKASFTDPGMVRQFGLRSEPPRKMEMIANNSYALFAYAVSELNKMNKRWRTYTCTIPFRPELRLGFPIFVPHLDIYAYLENISWNYTRGGQCTMNLGCTSVRWREMFGKEQEDSKTKVKSWIYTAVPDLVFAKTDVVPGQTGQVPNSQGRITDPKGSAATAAVDKGSEPTPAQKQQMERQAILQHLMAVEADKPGVSWRVQDDTEGFYKTARGVDKTYYDKVKTAMPYTDAGGYTLLRPFPWGRFIKLEEALDIFTRPAERQTGKLLPFEAKDAPKTATGSSVADTQNLGGANVPVASAVVAVQGSAADATAYLMSGLGTPSVSNLDPTKGTAGDNEVLATLNTIHDLISPDRADPAQKDADAIICFTLSYDEAFDTTTLAKDGNDFNMGASAMTNMALPSPGKPLPIVDPATVAKSYVSEIITKNHDGITEFSQ